MVSACIRLMASSPVLSLSSSTPPSFSLFSPLVRRPRQERDPDAGTDPEEQEEEGPSPEAHQKEGARAKEKERKEEAKKK